jgi:microcystin-dependent protein
MNRKLLLIASVLGALALLIRYGHATCATGAMPFQLQNNTPADATQVMANFNQISSGVAASCAGSGVNNDITALGALTTPITPAQGGTPVFTGAATGGLVNAQTLAVASNFSLTTGYIVTGFFGFTNTGPLTMKVNGTAAVIVNRKNQFGTSSTQGGEAVAGHPFEMLYNGTQFLLLGERFVIGEMRDYVGNAAAPPGWLIADGSTFACASFSDLCAVIGTTFGGTGANPALPDTRGRLLAGLDNYGTSIGAANRLTVGATGCGSVFSALGATCANASQSHTQIVAEIAAHNHGITEPNGGTGHSHNITGTFGAQYAGGASVAPFVNSSTTASANAVTGITINNNGSGQAMPIVNPNLGVVKIIRF